MNPLVNNVPQTQFFASPTSTKTKSPGEAQANFANMLKNAIENVNNSQLASDSKTNSLAKGEINDLHEVMIFAEKASVTIETTVQIQRKVIDAYNEIMRMQV